MRTKRRFISILLCLALILTSFAAMNIVQTSAADSAKKTTGTDYGLMSTVQSSTILQAWDWSYKNVEANLETIADQGFTTVQVSPASVLNGTSAGSTFNDAWKVYQPGALKMNAGSGMPDNNVLGTKAEFTSMCTKAHQLGVKIIVDTVVNHVGGDKFTESDTNPLNHLTADGYYVKNYQPELYNRNCFHDYYILNDWDDDWQLVKFAVLNLPDLNTSNTTVQTAAYNYLEELVAAGADGFRFDAAKHIETPSDRAELKSDFWTNTLTKVQNAHPGKEIYAYGETLGVGNNRQFSWYTSLMDVTDSGTSDSIRGAITNKTTNGATPWLPSGTGNPDQTVLWTESHDNFEGGSYGTPESQIGKIWALEAGRATVTSLYFGRPGNDSSYRSIALGTANKTGWANATTKAVNQFHNHFNGQNEYTSTEGDIAYIERGTTGAVLVNVTDGYGNISVTKHTLEDGSYTDAITGNTFTVGNGKISGSIGSTGVAVISKGSVSPVTPSDIEVKDGKYTVVFTNNKGWGAPNIYYWGGTGANTWPGDAMSYCGKNEYDQAQYVGYVPATCANIIINDGSNQSADGTISGHTGLYLKDTQVSGNYELGAFNISSMLPASTDPTTTTEPTDPTNPTTDNVVYLKPNSNWKQASARFAAYFFGTSGNTWVGMTETTDSGVYKCTVPSGTYENVIFCRMNGSTTTNSWDTKWNQTGDLTLTGNIGKCFTVPDGAWDGSTSSWGSYTPPTFNYTVNYTYQDYNGNNNTITRTVNNSTETDADVIAAVNNPSSKLKDPKYTYTLGSATKSGTTITAPLTKTEQKYTVKLNGETYSQKSYMQQETITTSTETGFLIDGKLVKTGTSVTFYVTGDVDVSTSSSATHEDTAILNITGTYIKGSNISFELLATANVQGFKRMGIAFSGATKTKAQIAAEVNSFTTLGATQVSNKIAVHNSTVDFPNSSGQYQFAYSPSVSVSNATGKNALYFYTFAVTDNAVVVSDVDSVTLSTLTA